MAIFDLIAVESRKQKNERKAAALYSQKLKSDLDLVSGRLLEIQETFDLVTDSELIDAMIYEELSLKSRYAYLLKLAKENHVTYKAEVKV